MSVQKNLVPLAEDGLPHYGYVRLPQILAVLPFSRAAFLGKVSAGVYPRPYKISARAVAWKVEDIRAILASFEQTTPDTIDKNVQKAIAHRHLSKRAQELV